MVWERAVGATKGLSSGDEGDEAGGRHVKIMNIEFEEERIVGIEFDCGCYFCKSDAAVHECDAHAEIIKP